MLKINNPLIKGTIKEIVDDVYAISIKDQYDRAMLFCRYQEFYESPYKQFRNRFFTLSEYMRFYTKKRNEETFTYTKDWSGYNLPSHILEKAIDKFSGKDHNTEYDKIMNDIFWHCQAKSFSRDSVKKKFYLIGVENFKDDTFRHELAHGIYYTNKDYKTICDDLVSKIKKRHYNYVKKVLVNLGYSNDDNIIKDEIQAYFSTGLHDKFDGDEIREYCQPFVKNFKDYSGK